MVYIVFWSCDHDLLSVLSHSMFKGYFRSGARVSTILQCEAQSYQSPSYRGCTDSLCARKHVSIHNTKCRDHRTAADDGIWKYVTKFNVTRLHAVYTVKVNLWLNCTHFLMSRVQSVFVAVKSSGLWLWRNERLDCLVCFQGLYCKVQQIRLWPFLISSGLSQYHTLISQISTGCRQRYTSLRHSSIAPTAFNLTAFFALRSVIQHHDKTPACILYCMSWELGSLFLHKIPLSCHYKVLYTSINDAIFVISWQHMSEFNDFNQDYSSSGGVY